MSSSDRETVVLVDDQNRVLGTMPKSEVHGPRTPLHRAFSCFVFRQRDSHLLLQQRSGRKPTWPLAWSNSCCGHPGPDESTLHAARRRLRYELGLNPVRLEEVAPYRYCYSRDGVMENEICPILVGIVDEEPVINPVEVEAVRWVDWGSFLEEIDSCPARFSEWCIEEARIVEETRQFKALMATASR